MTTQSENDGHAPSIDPETERVVREFVRDAVSRLSDTLLGSALEFRDDTQWERGEDGHFRQRIHRVWRLPTMLSDEWLESIPSLKACIDQMRIDDVVGPHLDRLIGTRMSASQVRATDILRSLMHAMLDDEGRFAFTDERFHRKWHEWAGLLGAGRIAHTMVAPLPGLVVPTFPLRLNNELVFDRLTNDEVTRCYEYGVIRLESAQFPLIYADAAVGIRRTVWSPKLIQRGDEAYEPLAVGDQGKFGERPPDRNDLVIDDVLSALRLFKPTRVRAAGLVSWTDCFLTGTSAGYRAVSRWLYDGCQLSEGEVPIFLELWKQLEEGADRWDFSIHRFNLAFERGLLPDRIVDLVIAAEALFLSDQDTKYRGELRFRIALRAAKFLKHPTYSEHDIFRVMRQAYDVRSAVVHGGSPTAKETCLPDNPSADLPAFVDAVEELVRLGLRKALSMKQDGRKLRQSEYWDDLVLSGPRQY